MVWVSKPMRYRFKQRWHYSELLKDNSNLNVNFDIIGISETWLNETNKDIYNLNGYNQVPLVRQDRIHGGVFLLISASISYRILNEISIVNKDIKCIFIEIELNVAEQITVRIVQIMIQATDLAQILYGGHYSRKNAGHAKFQYGRHFPRWPPWSILNRDFCLRNGSKWSKKIIVTTECMFFGMQNAQLML